MNIAVAMLRVQEGLDFTGVIADFDLTDLDYKQKSGIDNPQYSTSPEESITSNNTKSSTL